MDCQECDDNPATLHFTQIINGQKNEVHVCEQCAKEKGYMTYPEEAYSLQDLLEGFFNFDSKKLEKHGTDAYKHPQDLECSRCNLTLAAFKRTGKFGCAGCYHVFSSRIDPILRRVHSGNTKHYGKIPKRQGDGLRTKKEIKEYREKLKVLIEEEAFEEAALIRDKIKALKSNQTEPKAGDNG